MTTQTNKQYTTLVTLLVILILLGIGSVAYSAINYLDHKEKDRLAAENRKETVRALYYGTKYEYDMLKRKAPWWNKNFAKLTLNHTRDTVEKPNYTITEFAEYHRGIRAIFGTLFFQDNLIDRLHISQISNLFPYGLQQQNVIGTYRIKEKFYGDIQELDKIYYDILGKTKENDSVDLSYTNVHSSFRPYFELLEYMDKTFYNLLAYRFTQDLTFLGNSSPEFANAAKHQLFGKQTNNVRVDYYAIKQYGERPENGSRILTNDTPSDTTLAVYNVHRNGLKTMLITYTEKDIYPLTEAERIALLDRLDAQVPKFENEEERFYYVESNSDFYYATDSTRTLYPHVLEGDDKEILRFYDDDLDRYYILGEYDAFEAFHPGYNERIDSLKGS